MLNNKGFSNILVISLVLVLLGVGGIAYFYQNKLAETSRNSLLETEQKSQLTNSQPPIKPGFNFEGDDITLSILSKVLELDFVILTEISSRKYINKIQTPGNNFFIILNFISFGNSGHYRTIGFTLQGRKTPKTMFPIKLFSKVLEILYIKINATTKK